MTKITFTQLFDAWQRARQQRQTQLHLAGPRQHDQLIQAEQQAEQALNQYVTPLDIKTSALTIDAVMRALR